MKATALLLFPLLLLAGCSAFFGFNAFKTLDEPPAPSLSDYQGGSDGLAKLAQDLASPAVVDKLKADAATTQAVEAYLSTTYLAAVTLDTADQQTAAVLYGDLYLKTTSGDELVNNIVTSLVTSAQTGSVSSIISSIIPAGVAGDKAKFTAMVTGFLYANTAYLKLGASIPVRGVPPGMNMGDIAQKAAVAFLMQAVVDAIIASGAPDTAAAIDELFRSDPALGTVLVDPFHTVNTPLKNIFDAAGAPYPT
jgi:hypothetical protein